MSGETLTSAERISVVSLQCASRSWPRALKAALARLVDLVMTWQERAYTRRKLLGLDDRMLRDIGIDRATAQHEGEKPFWAPYR
jgi:uncharacterized protein YjiS (DUF1127 family)